MIAEKSFYIIKKCLIFNYKKLFFCNPMIDVLNYLQNYNLKFKSI